MVMTETETDAMARGVRLHRHIERLRASGYCGTGHVGDVHPGMSVEQLMGYARFAGVDEITAVHGGDLVHHEKKK